MRRWIIGIAICVFGIASLTILLRLSQFLSPIQYRTGKPISAQDRIKGQYYRDEDIQWSRNHDEILAWTESIVIDEKDRIWLPSDGHGLFMFDGNSWHQWWLRNDFHNAIRGLVVVDDQVYGISSNSSQGVIAHFDLDRMRWEIPWQQTRLSASVLSQQIAADSKGRIYVGLASQELGIYDDGKWKFHQMDIGCIGQWFQPFQVNSDDSLWMAGRSGYVCQFAQGQWTKYQFEDFSSEDDIKTPKFDSTGRLWLAFANSLAVQTPDHKWYHFSSERLPFDGRRIMDISIDTFDRIWVLTEDKLGAYNGEVWELIDLEELGEDLVGADIFPRKLAFDKERHVCLTTVDGVIILTEDIALKAFASDDSQFLAQAELLSVTEE